MAIISFTNYKRGQTTGCMSAVMRYTMQDKKTEFEGQQLVTGINCQPESVYADFMTTKRLYHKTDGVLFYHMVQSFPKGEAVDPVTAHAAALKLAEYYEGYEVLVCTHTDREHIHDMAYKFKYNERPRSYSEEKHGDEDIPSAKAVRDTAVEERDGKIIKSRRQHVCGREYIVFAEFSFGGTQSTVDLMKQVIDLEQDAKNISA